MADLASIQFKRIITTKVRPTAAQLLEGELAINLADGRIYTKDNSNIVKSLSDFAHGGVITNNFPYDNILSPGFYYDTNLALSTGKPSTEVTGTGYLLVFNTMDTANESNVVVSNPGSVTTQMFIGGLSGYVWTRTKPTLTGAWTTWSRPIYNGDPVNLKDNITLEATNATNGSSLIFKNVSNTTIGYIKYIEATGLIFNAGVHTMTLNKTTGDLVVPGAVFEGTNRVYSPNNIPTTDVIWAEAKLANTDANLIAPGQWKVPVGTLTNYPTLYTGNSDRDGFIECIKTNTGLIQNYLSTVENVWYTRTSTNGTIWSAWTRLINIDTTELTKLTQISSSGLNITGSVTTPIVNATVGVNTSVFHSNIPYRFYNESNAEQIILTGGLLTSFAYADANKVPINGIYSKGNIVTDGTVTAPTFIGALTGNADSASRLQIARNFQWTGDATGLLSFNGTTNVSAALTLSDTGVTAGTYQSVTVDTKGRVTAANNVITGLISANSTSSTANTATNNTNTYLNIVENVGNALSSTGSSIQVTGAGSVTVTSDNTGKITITGSQTITGNAASATKLQTARNINGVSFDGTSDINIQPVAVRINGGSDLNNYITPGYYYCDMDVESANTANTPTNFSYSLVITKTAGIIQTYTSYNGAGNSVYVRGFYDGSWTAWKKLAFTSDNITGNAASATKLQTARTINGVAFDGTANITIADNTKLPLTGGTINGSLNVSDTITITGVGDHANAFKKLIQGHTTTDGGYIAVGNNGDNKGYVEIGTTDDADEEIYATQRALIDNTVIRRAKLLDSFGNTSFPGTVTAPTFNGVLNGNAASATKLQTARTINGVSFDGTSNITIVDNTKLPLTGGTINGSITTTNLSVRSGLINSDDNNHYIDIGKDGVDRMNFGSYGGIFNFYNTNGSTIGVSIANNKVKATTFEGALNGNAATATKLQTARTINGIVFDGTSDITIADNTKLPLTGGTLTGNLITKTSFLAQTIQELGVGGNTPIRVPEIAVPLEVSGYIPFIHGAILTANYGYRTQISIGGYRGSNTWNNSGAYIAIGGQDTNPVESFRFLHGRRITNSTGPILLEGNATSATRLETTRSIFGQLFDGTNDVSGSITASTGIVKSSNSHYIDMGRDSVDRMNFYNYGANYNFIDSRNNATCLSINGTTVSASNLRLSGSVYCSKYKSNSRVWLTDHSEYNAQGMNVGSLFVGDRYAEDIYTPNNGIYAKGIILSESGFHGKLLAKDSRIFKPLNAESGGISAYFVTEVGLNNDHTGGNYGDFLSLNTYNDASAGNQNGLFFDKTGKRIVHYQSGWGAANWGSGKTLAYAEDVLSTNGGTMNAPINFTLSHADGAFHKLIEGSTVTDGGYIAVGNHGSDKGYLELGTTDDIDAAIYARKRNAGNAILEEAVILGPDGSTSFPHSVFIHNALGGYGRNGLVKGNGDNAAYVACNIDITSWFGVGIKASNSGERTVVFNARNGDISNKGSLYTEQAVNGRSLGVNNTEGAGTGLSLHNGATGGLPNYGISFAQTSNFGTHGYVGGDWATYFTMAGGGNRGWIFRSADYGNVASISANGHAYFNGNINVNGFITCGSSDIRVLEGSNYTLVYDYSTRIVRIIMKVMANLSIIEAASPFKALAGAWTANFILPISIKTRLSAEMHFNNTGLDSKRWIDEASEWMVWCAPVGVRGSTENEVVVNARRWGGSDNEKVDGYLVVTGIF